MANDTEVLDTEEMQALRTVLRANANVVTALDRELEAAHNLGLPDFEVLSQLSETPDHSLRMTELAKGVLLSPSGLTRRLDGLVKTGLVERAPCPSDGRGLLAVITQKGTEALQQMVPTHAKAVRAHFINCVSQDQLRLITQALGPIAERDSEEMCESDSPKGEVSIRDIETATISLGG